MQKLLKPAQEQAEVVAGRSYLTGRDNDRINAVLAATRPRGSFPSS
jgi:hypothetical protein